MTGMFTWLYDVSGTADEARAAIRDVLQQRGFVIQEASADEWHAQYGEKPSFLAQMTGNPRFPVILTVLFQEEPTGMQIELKRPTAYGLGNTSHGGVTLMHLDQDYRATAAAVHERLAQAGVLVDARE